MEKLPDADDRAEQRADEGALLAAEELELLSKLMTSAESTAAAAVLSCS